MDSNKYAHRKSKIRLNITFADGKPAANKEVAIEMKDSEFLFGIGGFDAVEYAGGGPDGEPISAESSALLKDRLDKLFKLFNYATLPFYLARYEPVEGFPDEARLKAAAKYYKDRGITVKGHPLCWHTACADWLMDYSNDEILKRQIARIERDVTAFKGLIDIWDVINEVVIMPIFNKYDNAITRVCKEIGRVGIVEETFAAARKANSCATLVLNDFDTSTNYEILIDGCLAAGIPIDVIGVQSHQHMGYWGLEKTLKVLERFTHFGLPVHFTENTILSGDIITADIDDLNDYIVDAWPSTPEGEERQAREVTEFYEALFCNPAVGAITTWDATDGKWLKAPSGILREDNGIKPVYEALTEKIKGDWRTQPMTIVTDADGALEFSGFRGSYELALNGVRRRFPLDGKNAEILIRV